jgi:hypothetical protein
MIGALIHVLLFHADRLESEICYLSELSRIILNYEVGYWNNSD